MTIAEPRSSRYTADNAAPSQKTGTSARLFASAEPAGALRYSATSAPTISERVGITVGRNQPQTPPMSDLKTSAWLWPTSTAKQSAAPKSQMPASHHIAARAFMKPSLAERGEDAAVLELLRRRLRAGRLGGRVSG